MEIRKRDGFKNERHITFPIKNFLVYLTNPLVDNSYITEAGYYPKAENHFRERLDGIDEGILIFCLEGAGTIRVFQKKQWKSITIKRNMIYCIPPQIAHSYFSDKDTPWSIIWVHFESSLIQHLPTMMDNLKRELIEENLMSLFSMERRNLTLANAIYMSSLLKHLLILIYFYEDQEDQHKRTSILKSCIDYMNQHLKEKLVLKDLTKKFNISTSYLNMIFKNETGKSPIDFFIKLKMDEACTLLRITKMKVIEVAHELGYQDAYYFSRVFKKTIGVSPKTYREGHIAVKDFFPE